MFGAGYGGGATVQWTPSIAVTLHVGLVSGASLSSKVAGVESRILKKE